MKNTLVAAAMSLALVPCALAAGGAVFAPSGDLKWQDVPDAKGAQLAAVEGNPGKGASHFFIKFAPGFSAPLHHHSANHHVTVISGTVVLTVDGKEHKLPAGSYFAFSGKKPHATRCDTGAECVLSVDARSKWDVVPQKK